jgi:hypothetical protein
MCQTCGINSNYELYDSAANHILNSHFHALWRQANLRAYLASGSSTVPTQNGKNIEIDLVKYRPFHLISFLALLH